MPTSVHHKVPGGAPGAPAAAPLRVGTCGWQYRDWRGRLYPEKLPQREWLEHYAARFQTVEVDNTFYRLPKAEVFAAWRERTPAGVLLRPQDQPRPHPRQAAARPRPRRPALHGAGGPPRRQAGTP